MATINSFNAWLPQPQLASDIIAPPYDVLNTEEALEILNKNPNSYLKVTKSETYFYPNIPKESDKIYKQAKTALDQLIAQNHFQKNKSKSLYIYRLESKTHQQTGIVATSAVADYATGKIKKHELTRPDKELDRIKHTDTTNANTEPVLLFYKQTNTLSQWIKTQTDHPPYLRTKTEDNITHTLWIVSEKASQEGITLFNAIPETYIADGHHRAAAAFRVWEHRKAQNPNHTGNEAYNYFLSVLFPHTELKILDYNRVIKTLNGHTPNKIIDIFKTLGTVTPINNSITQNNAPQQKGQFAVYINNEWLHWTIDPKHIPKDPVQALDVSLLQNHILNPVFGIDNPRTSPDIDFVGGSRGLKELEKRCHQDAKLAIALYPTTIEELIQIADNQQIMPPKSTWFEPKLGSGLFIHTL